DGGAARLDGGSVINDGLAQFGEGRLVAEQGGEGDGPTAYRRVGRLEKGWSDVFPRGGHGEGARALRPCLDAVEEGQPSAGVLGLSERLHEQRHRLVAAHRTDAPHHEWQEVR